MIKIKMLLVYTLSLLFFSNIVAQVPVITLQPSDQSVFVGSTATFSLEATSAIAITYEWYKDGVSIAGATSDSYTTPSAILGDDGSTYYCIVSNDSGLVESDNVILNVSFPNERISDGLQALYNFDEGSGSIINDVSGVGVPLNLSIITPDAVNWSADGLTLVNRAAISSNSYATKIIDACRTSNEITIEAWIRSSTLAQGKRTGRIAGISEEKDIRNATLWQNESIYGVSLRTSETDNDGHPAFNSLDETVDLSLTHVLYTRSASGISSLYKNGNLVNTQDLGGDFSNWATNEKFVIGDEPDNSNNPWEGTYYLIAIYSKALSELEVDQNFNMGVPLTENLVIAHNPVDEGNVVGGFINFEVGVVGNLPITYQWQFFDGAVWESLPNTNVATVTFDNPTIWLDNRNLRCIVSNAGGSLISEVAHLSVADTTEKVTSGIFAYYQFNEGSGNVVNDVSGVGDPLNLEISDMDAVEWTDYGLLVNSSTSISSLTPATKIIEACKNNNEITIDVWIKPSNVGQFSSRILTISENANLANVQLKQDGESYKGTIRTSESSGTGTSVSSENGTASEGLVHLVFTRSWDGFRSIYVDGVGDENYSSNHYFGDFSSWNNAYKLGLGNEFVDDRFWAGLLNSVTIFNRELSPEEVAVNFAMGPNGSVSNLNAPNSLSANPLSESEIVLTWEDNSNEAGFVIERSIGDSISYVSIDSVGNNVTTYSDISIEESKNYFYRIKAYNVIVQSNYSNEIKVSSLLNSPSDLSVQALTFGQIILRWTENSSFEEGTIIERGEGNPITYTQIDTVASNVNSYFDETVGDKIEYFYKLQGYNNITNSNYSNIANITSLFADIGTPTDLSVILDPNYGVPVLNWSDNSNNEVGFIIERKIAGFEYSTIDTVDADSSSYIDASVEENTIYLYRVMAFNENTISSYGNVVDIGVLTGIDLFVLPSEFSLSQNYPNPFNPTTTISFELPEQSAITIKVYNLLGQEVLQLIDDVFNAGSYKYSLDASKLTSGIYIYVINAEGISGNRFSNTKKMILLK